MPLKPGDTRTKPYLFDAAGITAFAAAAGDTNPLHYPGDHAASGRFKDMIASGAHMSAVLMGFGASMLSEESEAVGLEFTFRFERAIPAGTPVQLSWAVLSSEPHAKLRGDLVTVEGSITGVGGQRYVSATGKGVVWDAGPSQG